MILGIFHKGSGLGNQLHRFVAARILAMRKGVDFGMIAPELFKGKDFMDVKMGRPTAINYQIEEGTGKVMPYTDLKQWNEWDKNTYDPDFNFVEDNTIIDGNFEDERYFIDNLEHIKHWLETEYEHIPDSTCVIGFRGGEYYTVPELGLPKEYFERAIREMLEINPEMKFEVHTDDESLAKEFFPDYPIIRDVSRNWRAMRYAKYAIIANSSFYVLPRLMRQHSEGVDWEFRPIKSDAVTIAPRYWNRYNTKKWDYPQGYYKYFNYI
jgi:hypothetical protein